MGFLSGGFLAWGFLSGGFVGGLIYVRGVFVLIPSYLLKVVFNIEEFASDEVDKVLPTEVPSGRHTDTDGDIVGTGFLGSEDKTRH